jgi:hypothetical protein
MNMFRNIIVTACFFCLPMPLSTAQDHGEEIFTAIIKSIEVLEKAFNESFELEISRTQSARSETVFKLSNTYDEDSETIRLCRVLRSKINDEFCLSASSGYNGLTIKSGKNKNVGEEKSAEQVDYQELSDTYFIYGKNGETVTGRSSRNDVSVQRGTLPEKLDYVFALEGGCKFPITQIAEHLGSVTNYLDPLIDFCSDSQNQKRITKTEEDTKDGKVIVYRIKYIQDHNYVRAQKIVVSNDGFDKGLIRENQIGYLKSNQFSLPYTSEKQLTSEQVNAVKIKWKVASLRADSDETLIIPDRIAKSTNVLSAVKSTKSYITQFDWKPLSEESKKKISLEEAKKTTEEQLKTINKMLKR